MNYAETVRAMVGRIHSAGGAPLQERRPGSGVHVWKTRLGRWPFEFQVDRFALMVRVYLGDELFATGRIPEREADALLAPRAGPGDPEALRGLAEFVDAEFRADSRRFLKPPHADRHPDRREDPRQGSTIRALPGRLQDEPG